MSFSPHSTTSRLIMSVCRLIFTFDGFITFPFCLPCLALPGPALPRRALPCRVVLIVPRGAAPKDNPLSYNLLALPCLASPCRAPPCLAAPCPAVPCPAAPCTEKRRAVTRAALIRQNGMSSFIMGFFEGAVTVALPPLDDTAPIQLPFFSVPVASLIAHCMIMICMGFRQRQSVRL